MKRAAYIVLLSLAGVFGMGIAHRVVPAREPVHQGKPLGDWLQDLNSTALYTQETAKTAIREMGTNAVLALTQILQSRDSRFKLLFMELSAKQSVVRFRLRTVKERQRLAIKGCRALGPLARPAIPALIGFLNDAETANEAAYSLVVIDEGIFPMTRAATNQNYDPAVRSAAAARLASGQYDETTVVAVLLTSLRDNHPEVSSQAARSLGLIRKEPDVAVPALVESLQIMNAVVRREAAIALGRFGPKAQSALPELLLASQDGNRMVRQEAVRALGKINQAAIASGK